MANEKQIDRISRVQRALGIIEGVMMLADTKVEQALSSAVCMIDEVIDEVQKDG